MSKLVAESLNQLFENKQLADKVYFKTGKLSPEDKEIIYDITAGDNTTKLICDIYTEEKEYFIDDSKLIHHLKEVHTEVLNYDKNVYPIKDYDILNINNIQGLASMLITRKKIITYLKQLPSVAVRNLKADIRKPRGYRELEKYHNDFEYFMMYFQLLSNKTEKGRQILYNKMFKSETNMDNLSRFIDEKSDLIGNEETSRQEIIDIVEENYESLDIVYDKNNVMIVEVSSADGIKLIGCLSVWCFTYGNDNYRMWRDYSHNGLVYVIIDFNSPQDSEEFMLVLIHPIPVGYKESEDETDSPLYDMANQQVYHPVKYLQQMFGRNFRKYFKFE